MGIEDRIRTLKLDWELKERTFTSRLHVPMTYAYAHADRLDDEDAPKGAYDNVLERLYEYQRRLEHYIEELIALDERTRTLIAEIEDAALAALPAEPWKPPVLLTQPDVWATYIERLTRQQENNDE